MMHAQKYKETHREGVSLIYIYMCKGYYAQSIDVTVNPVPPVA